MSINLIPEGALPKSFFLEADYDRDWRESQPDWPGTDDAGGPTSRGGPRIAKEEYVSPLSAEPSPMAAGTVTA
jgi:hypothetical protein